MLFQITNTCYEECPHCMDCSKPNEPHALLELLPYVANFFSFLDPHILVISGGEPTTHPDFVRICEYFGFAGIPFTITSNGTWVFDEDKRKQFEHVVRLPNYVGAQIYTDKRFYRSYDKIKEHKEYFESLKGVVFEDTNLGMAMMDFGRAKTYAPAQQIIDEQNYAMGCVNSTLIAHQSKTIQAFRNNVRMALNRMFCKPLVDVNGNVHMSESWLCPSVGNVKDDYMMEIFKNMQQFTPCKRCRNYDKFMKSDNPQHIAARKVLGLDQ